MPRASLAAAALLLGAHAALVLDQASRQSATYDEPYYASSGWARIAGGKRGFNPEHPPAGKLLLGATWLGAPLPPPASISGFGRADQWTFGPHALYDRASLAPGLMLRARAVVALLSVLLGAGVLLLARRLFGEAAGVLALALYALDPLVVANAGLATLDMPVTALLFAAAGLAWWGMETGRRSALAGAAVAAGLALAVKGTGLVAIPAVAMLAAAPLLREGGAAPGESRRRAVLAGLVLAGAAVVLALACLPEGGPSAWWRAIQQQRRHVGVGHAAYAFGLHARHCWSWYFPVAWGVKTPLPLLAASAAGVVLVAARVRRSPEVVALLLAPPAILLAAATSSGICNGVRQVLPVTPFLAVAGGGALAALARGVTGRIAAGGVVAWMALALLRVHPHAIAYSNEAAGGPSRTWERLADSNVDWGQGLPALAETLRGVPVRQLWLDYFGTAWPPAHGIESYRRLRDPRFRAGQVIPEARADGDARDGRELVAVSATMLADVYTENDLHAWLRHRRPWAWAGHSIAVYDVTGDAAAHRMLAGMAERMRDPVTAAEAWGRAEEIAAGRR